MNIRQLQENEIKRAMELVWKVFLKYEAPDYSEEGIHEFKRSINDAHFVEKLEVVGAFENEELLGIIATRNKNHIALFFVDEKYHKQGIGRKLFNYANELNESGYFTANSSPYAKKVYEHLGFVSLGEEKVVNGIRFFEMRKDKKYVKVMFGQTSGANNSFEYKIGEVNIANNWNPSAIEPKEMGGFNFSTEDKILRWLIRGDTIYDVKIPEDAEIIDVPHSSTPHGVFRANKIIISNPRQVTDEMAMELYKKSTIPEKSYYKAMVGCAIRGYMNTALQILKDKVNTENIDIVINEFKDFCTNKETGIFDENELGTNAKKIYELLLEIKNNFN